MAEVLEMADYGNAITAARSGKADLFYVQSGRCTFKILCYPFGTIVDVHLPAFDD